MSSTLILFDVDGTLTVPRNIVRKEMLDFLKLLRMKHKIGIVGGSDFDKIQEQLSEPILENFDYIFSENGLLAFKDGKYLAEQSIKEYLGEDNLKKLINFILHYIADLDIPIKRGTFVEFRKGMLNICPIGRNCTQEERDAFGDYDKVHNIRKTLVSTLEKEFKELNLKYSIGGQISFDIFPIGWDKTYCLQFVEDEFDVIHFFGDKTYEGGNDFEIFHDSRVQGHTVKSPQDTLNQCQELFLS